VSALATDAGCWMQQQQQRQQRWRRLVNDSATAHHQPVDSQLDGGSSANTVGHTALGDR